MLFFLALREFAHVPVQGARPFDGTYTIVNKADGRRMIGSDKDGLFVVGGRGPIYRDQMWLFAPQDNDSYAIVNAANGMRVLAQSTDGEAGFFAIDHGPIYQDQRWYLTPQTDGSHVFVNVKSGRRIISRTSADGKHRFAAIASSGPVEIDEAWWVINQERDDTAYFVAELQVERSRISELAREVAAAKNVSEQLNLQLRTSLQTQQRFTMETEMQRLEAQNALSKLRETEAAKGKLAGALEAHRAEIMRLLAELQEEKQSKENLHSVQGQLAEELGEVKSVRQKLVATLSSMQTQVDDLNLQLNATRQLNLELTSQVELMEELPETWLLDVRAKLLATALAIGFAAIVAACTRGNIALRSDVKVKQGRISSLEKELHAEFGSMVSVGDF